MIICRYLGCIGAIKSNKWSKIRAEKDGWFFDKDGSALCPGHIPSWLNAWRKKK